LPNKCELVLGAYEIADLYRRKQDLSLESESVRDRDIQNINQNLKSLTRLLGRRSSSVGGFSGSTDALDYRRESHQELFEQVAEIRDVLLYLENLPQTHFNPQDEIIVKLRQDLMLVFDQTIERAKKKKYCALRLPGNHSTSGQILQEDQATQEVVTQLAEFSLRQPSLSSSIDEFNPWRAERSDSGIGLDAESSRESDANDNQDEVPTDRSLMAEDIITSLEM
jgi:hypothetical protein